MNENIKPIPNFLYSIEADMDVCPLQTELMSYEKAKEIYSEWKQDKEVFNICMYRHDGIDRTMMYIEEIY